MSRLYLVDDHPLVRDGLRAMLAGSGHDIVGEAGDAATALGELATLCPDALLLDLGLADGSGLDVLRLVQRFPDPPRTLVLTMSVRPRDVAESMRLGAHGYLLKNSSRAELLEAIDAVLRGETVFPPQVAALSKEAADDDGAERLAQLSPRERQIVRLVVEGGSSALIGARLGLSPKTVDTYRSRLMAKIGVADVTALVRFAVKVGLIDARD